MQSSNKRTITTLFGATIAMGIVLSLYWAFSAQEQERDRIQAERIAADKEEYANQLRAHQEVAETEKRVQEQAALEAQERIRAKHGWKKDLPKNLRVPRTFLCPGIGSTVNFEVDDGGFVLSEDEEPTPKPVDPLIAQRKQILEYASAALEPPERQKENERIAMEQDLHRFTVLLERQSSEASHVVSYKPESADFPVAPEFEAITYRDGDYINFTDTHSGFHWSTREQWVGVQLTPELLDTAARIALREGRITERDAQILADNKGRMLRNHQRVVALFHLGPSSAKVVTEPTISSERNGTGRLLTFSPNTIAGVPSGQASFLWFEDPVCPGDATFSITMGVHYTHSIVLSDGVFAGIWTNSEQDCDDNPPNVGCIPYAPLHMTFDGSHGMGTLLTEAVRRSSVSLSEPQIYRVAVKETHRIYDPLPTPEPVVYYISEQSGWETFLNFTNIAVGLATLVLPFL